MNDPISAEEYFRGTLKVIAHWAEVDLSGEWETGLRGVIRSITDAAREVLSAHPVSPGAALAEPATVAADLDGGDARPNSGLDSRDRGHNETLIRQLREIATEFAIDNKTDCKQHVCWIAADTIARSSEQSGQSMTWERPETATIDDNAHYVVRHNGHEWRDFDLMIMRGLMVKWRLEPNYVRGRPEWIAKIVRPDDVSSPSTEGGNG